MTSSPAQGAPSLRLRESQDATPPKSPSRSRSRFAVTTRSVRSHARLRILSVSVVSQEIYSKVHALRRHDTAPDIRLGAPRLSTCSP